MAKEQVYQANGLPLDSVALQRDEFRQHPGYLHGTVHVWVWRRTADGDVEVLVQKRSQDKKNNPGKFDTSSAGHIDANESPITSAIREADEEIGLTIDQNKLLFVATMRKLNVDNIIANAYLYEVDRTFEAVFNDGEVESVSWHSLDDFEVMVRNPIESNFVSHGDEYFTMLLAHLRQL